jgi:hypothetical protein
MKVVESSFEQHAVISRQARASEVGGGGAVEGYGLLLEGPAWSRNGDEMSYYADVNTAKPHYDSLTRSDFCFECGKSIAGGVVLYDGYVEHQVVKTISLHPACAALLGQRLITDGYPNRRNSL